MFILGLDPGNGMISINKGIFIKGECLNHHTTGNHDIMTPSPVERSQGQSSSSSRCGLRVERWGNDGEAELSSYPTPLRRSNYTSNQVVISTCSDKSVFRGFGSIIACICTIVWCSNNIRWMPSLFWFVLVLLVLLLNHKSLLCCCGFCHCHGCRTKDALPSWSPAQQRSPENSLRPGFARWSGGFERRSMVETELSMISLPVRWCKVELLLYLVSTGVLLTGFMDASTDSSAGHEGLRANKTATQSILSVLFRPIWFAQTKSDFPDPCCNVQSPSLLFHIESRFPRFRKPKTDDMGYLR